jgi:type I restriction enzyme S subunit
MKLAKYDSYKDSGVEWQREIPEFWKSYRFKDITLIQTSNVDKKTDENEEEVFLCNYIDVYKNDFINKSLNFMKATAKKDQISKFKLSKNDVIITKDSETAEDMAKPALVVEELKNIICGYHLALVKSKKYFVDNKFIFRLFQSSDFHWNFIVKSKGVTRVGLSINNAVNNQELFLPPISEQNKISNFLDQKTSQIDKKIKLLQEKKESYEELKKSLINETVCRGIDKNVELKDSGIEWIGKIPKHWNIKRNKNLFIESKELSNTGKEDLLSVSEYTGVSIKSKDIKTGNNSSRADSLINYKICKKGDLVINIMLAWKTGLGVSPYFGIVSPAYCIYRPKNSIFSKYYHYLFRTELYIAEFRRNSTGIISSRLRLYSDKFFAIHVIVQPKREQIQIANYLDKKTSKIDNIISKINDQVETLKEFRKTLINDVVTGKVRIQDE